MLQTRSIIVGRGGDCDIVIASPRASRRHLEFRVERDGTAVRDLGSKNGTRLNDTALPGSFTVLRHGDELRIADLRLRYMEPHQAVAATGPGVLSEDTELATHVVLHTFSELIADDPSLITAPLVEASILSVVVAGNAPKLIIREHDQTRDVVLDEAVLTIGRSPASRVQLSDSQASSNHAEIQRREEAFWLVDCQSRNGTRVNGMRADEHLLTDGDTIRIGQTALVYRDVGGLRPPVGRRRPVVLVPGFAGSELWLGETKLWPGTRRLLMTPQTQLLDDWNRELRVGRMLRESAVVPGLTKNDSFGSLLTYLTRQLGYVVDQDLMEFPYDWRGDLLSSATRLAEEIGAWRSSRPAPAEKVTLVCHSMGGLVARLFLAQPGAADIVERCVFMGTPHAGSAASLSIILGGTRLPLGLAFSKLRELSAGFDSLYQVLPVGEVARFDDGRAFRPFEADPSWLPASNQTKLARAIEVRRALDNDGSMPVRNTCIFGYRQNTLVEMTVARGDDGVLVSTGETFAPHGDGVVTEESAVLRGAEIHPVCQQHSVLFSDPDVLHRLRYELVER